jgi:uncharacterized protein YggE
VNASGGAVYRSRNEPIMHLHSRILAAIPAVVLALHAHPQAMGNLMYETNSRIFFQQAEQPVKASIQGNMLILEVNAMMNMKADSYLAIFHITQLGQSAEEADSLMNARIDGFTQRVKEHGVKEKDVFPDMLSFVPVYEIETTRKLFSKTYQEVPAGFEIQKNIHVRFTDASILDRLVTAAAKEEIYDLVKVDFFVVDQSACYDTLRMFATKLLQQKLDNFAKLGLQGGREPPHGVPSERCLLPAGPLHRLPKRTQSELEQPSQRTARQRREAEQHPVLQQGALRQLRHRPARGDHRAAGAVHLQPHACNASCPRPSRTRRARRR